jgi:CRP-like cAMP-binding protein
MVLLEDLKKIILLGNLTEGMREKLLPHIDMLNYEEEESIFREGDDANRLYMLKRGKVLLEKRISEKITISFGSVKEGFTFGWSAMLDEGPYTSDAICADPCEVFSLRRETIMRLMDNDHEMGYIFTQRMLRVMKKRLDHRTDQFLRSIITQPDLQNLFKA